MSVLTKYLNLRTKGELDMIDITESVSKAINEINIRNGTVTVFVPGSTGALTTIEYEPGLLKDFPEMLERIAPRNIDYEHEKRWHDHNGHSHVRASLIGPSLTIPFKDKKLTLGTWQQVVFIELDIHGRSRELVLQIMGE
ncbi:MAG: YjbQ family protein [archaeon]|nr:YjbQ family protein [archaeon]